MKARLHAQGCVASFMKALGLHCSLAPCPEREAITFILSRYFRVAVLALQGEATTYPIDIKMEMELSLATPSARQSAILVLHEKP